MYPAGLISRQYHAFTLLCRRRDYPGDLRDAKKPEFLSVMIESSPEDTFRSVVEHVFFPPKLPQSTASDDEERNIAIELTTLVRQSVEAYRENIVAESERTQWSHIYKMVEQLASTARNTLLTKALSNHLSQMLNGDVCALHIRAQNAGFIIRKSEQSAVFEAFGVSQKNEAVIDTVGKLICSYPGPAVEIPEAVFLDPDFQYELSSVLSQMDVDHLELPTTIKARSEVQNIRETTDPKHITHLLVETLRAMGKWADVRRVTKRIADDVLWYKAHKPWRRSPLWLVIRVALQTTLVSQQEYKRFMVFLMSRVLRLAVTREFPSDLLFTMRAKVARRLAKLSESSTPPFVNTIVKEVVGETGVLLEKRWDRVKQTQAQSPPSDFSGVDFKAATNITLPNSGPYIESVLQRSAERPSPSPFIPSEQLRSKDIKDFSSCTDGQLLDAVSRNGRFALFDFEESVRNHLDNWARDKLADPKTPRIMSSCIEQYYDSATELYASNPEDESIMIVTILRLWVVLDKAVTQQYPLLAKYSPEIPASFLHPLLLRQSTLIDQASSVEQYLKDRHSAATKYDHPSIFSNSASATSFAVSYFGLSCELQKIKVDIESDAQEKRARKEEELKELNKRHASLTNEAARLSCEWESRIAWNGPYNVHSWYCRKCSLEAQAGNMSISVYEWPLPRVEGEAKRVVFELACPLEFILWRNITFRILSLSPSTSRPKDVANVHRDLINYAALQSWILHVNFRHIGLCSDRQSFNDSYLKPQQIPANVHNVCVNHGPVYRLYDRNSREWIREPFHDANVESYGTFTIPETSVYRYLERTLAATTHTSNEILSEQSHCPPSLSLHEHIAYGTLRAGGNLQWMNIARELASNSLTFNHEDVQLLLLQAAWQLGPLADDRTLREWHLTIHDDVFCEVLLDVLEKLLNSVESNWKECATVRSIILLAARVLSSHSNTCEVAHRTYKLLRKARHSTYEWLKDLQEALQRTTEEAQIFAYSQRMCAVAATCRSTYDVEILHLPSVLQTRTDVCMAIHCAVVIHNNWLHAIKKAPAYLQRLLHRDCRLSHFLEQRLHALLQGTSAGLDRAIGNLWSRFLGNASTWSQLPEPNDRWWHSSNDSTGDVHCNLLTGQLLVNGKPLGRLPKSFVTHPTYERVFGQQILEVIPSILPAMEFATRDLIGDYEVHFAMAKQQLLIQAKDPEQDAILELIPYRILSPDFPNVLIPEYSHWLNLNTGIMEFRPLTSMWKPQEDIWRLYYKEAPRRMVLGCSLGGSHLIDLHSPAFHMAEISLRPLDSQRHIIATYTPSGDPVVAVELPRYKLSFFVNSGHRLESRDLRGKVIDENQSSGTMFGLRNQLVLRNKNEQTRDQHGSRRVIVPMGDVVITTRPIHVLVSINTGVDPHMSYHIFTIDEDLGRLCGTGSLTSWFYLIYLHSVTSHCLADPLTGQTGTEEALYALSSARSYSAIRLDESDNEILSSIAKLTPSREYHPTGSRMMQTVGWHDALPSLCQNQAFRIKVHDILSHFAKFDMFYDRPSCRKPLNMEDSDLHRRASHRSKVYYRDHVLETSGHNVQDMVHEHYARQKSFVFSTARLTQRNTDTLIHCSQSIWDSISSWGMIGLEQEGYELASLSYNRNWLSIKLAEGWITLLRLCRFRDASTSRRRYQLAFSLAAMVFGNSTLLPFVPILVTLSMSQTACQRSIPPMSSYDLHYRFSPNRDCVRELVKDAVLPFQNTPAFRLTRGPREDDRSLSERQRRMFDNNTTAAVEHFTTCLLAQWPSVSLSSSPGNSSWLDVGAATSSVQRYFVHCSENNQFKEYVEGLDRDIYALDGLSRADVDLLEPNDQDCAFLPNRTSVQVLGQLPTLKSILQKNSPTADLLELPASQFPTFQWAGHHNAAKTGGLQHLLESLSRGDNGLLQRRYVDGLHSSTTALASSGRKASLTLRDYVQVCAGRLNHRLRSLEACLAPVGLHDHVLRESCLWPQVTIRSLLKCINRYAQDQDILSPEWRQSIINVAQILAELQRSQRLLAYHFQNMEIEFMKESQNSNFDTNEAVRNPEWLLIQVEGNFLMRPEQTEIAHEMIAPESGNSTSLQLNMGEGKSSVILPIVASTLAHGNTLVRVVILKPLARQMHRLLVERLSGLCNRRIFYMPFSRSLRMGVKEIQQMQDLYEQCLSQYGILLIQPEHILSLKLMSVDLLTSTEAGDNAALALHRTQDWLNENSRDILDESDELLHVRYQLIYTMGHQQSIENHPDRWETIQWVLSLTRKHATRLHEQYPDEVEVFMQGAGTFPMIRIFGSHASQKLSCLICKDVLNNEIEVPSASFGLIQSEPMRDLLRDFIRGTRDLTEEEYASLNASNRTTWSGLLLLRGLLACGAGILRYALSERRWKVDYGHDFRRSLLAVPYRAKDVPSLRAEFGHPDVAIVLTCLSYYYAGLDSDQLRQCFELLSKQDNPDREYEKWTQEHGDIHESLRTLRGVNLDDAEQFQELVALFSKNSAVANFYMSQVVFPKEAKEFPHKLSTSSWDLVEKKKHVTTGFSGTNDNQFLLPSSISQLNRPDQESTNARNIQFLLQPENSTYVPLQEHDMPSHSTQNFLSFLTRDYPGVRILLDVGAQMLEYSNYSLVGAWLSLRPEIPAGVFFSELDDLTVLTQDGRVIPLHSSPFQQQLDECIVYLDDAHTRGTDLKLPHDARAIVTLGPKVTKDRLLQGCMRMRKLGHGQSVMFCAPPEVDRRIREVNELQHDVPIEVANILRWTIQETLADIEHHLPQWAQQGLDHAERVFAREEYSMTGDVATLRDAWVQKEAKSLEELYGRKTSTSNTEHPAFQNTVIGEHLRSLGVTSLSNSGMSEEQEREVSQELEQEREVERPPKVTPAKHQVHRDVRQFVRSGSIPDSSDQFITIVRMFPPQETLSKWSRNSIFLTCDFIRTIVPAPQDPRINDYMRPVNWIISAGNDGMSSPVFVVMSPFEVNHLLPMIRQSKAVRLHIYSPRVTKAMRSFSNLTFYTIPSMPVVEPPSVQIQAQLGIWAGQLYVDGREMYDETKRLLGIDGNQSDEGALPVDIVKRLVSLRRKAMGYSGTHIGKILHFHPLSEADFH
ncbi:unnamed protein product [Somion occarium]|uniref:ubiquitinyl hydrolase 1 n=1 Tax=Somion occarium TaxID=3059160 RepID=A0ABP1DFN0_9APHY